MARERTGKPARTAETAPYVVIADDHAPVRRSLRRLLEREGLTVVGEARDGHAALRLTQRYDPDLAILDFAMPRLSGIEATLRIRAAGSRTRTIVLSAHGEEQYVRAALEAGASAYVLKSRAAGDLVQAIRTVLGGETFLSPVLVEAGSRPVDGERRTER